MDDRQRTIVEGAGLEESRLNQDFIDFLRKWGTPLLLVVVLVAGAYSGLTMWKRYKERTHDQAYADLHSAAVAGSPDNLVVVAEQHKGRGAVYELALIEAADAYLDSARLGVRPGGNPGAPEDRLTDEQVKANLSRAGELYAQVVEVTARKAGHEIHAINGYFGRAAVAESLGDLNAAREALTRAGEAARSKGFVELAKVAEERIATLDTLRDVPTLYSGADVRSNGSRVRPQEPDLNSALGGSLAPDPFQSGVGPVAPPTNNDAGDESETAPTP